MLDVIEIIVEVGLVIAVVLYILIMMKATAGWMRLKVLNPTVCSSTVTVVVPFRNEALNLPRLLNSLHNQDYESGKWEVIFVNDHSEDNSAMIVSDFITRFSVANLSLANLPAGSDGKKAAISYAISLSKFDLILTTDADTYADRNWVRAMTSFREKSDMDMVCGPVRLQGSGSPMDNLQELEYIFLQGSGAGLMEAGIPVLCSGANLLFKRKVFQDVDGCRGNEEIRSGDDTFLMFKFWKNKKGSVGFNKSVEAIVKTGVEMRFDDIISQRARWASKVTRYRSLNIPLLGVATTVAHLAVPVGLYFCIMSDDILLWCLMVTLKIMVDLFFLLKLQLFYKSDVTLFYFLIFEFTYPVFLLILFLYSLRSNHQWKGRSIKSVHA